MQKTYSQALNFNFVISVSVTNNVYVTLQIQAFQLCLPYRHWLKVDFLCQIPLHAPQHQSGIRLQVMFSYFIPNSVTIGSMNSLNPLDIMYMLSA